MAPLLLDSGGAGAAFSDGFRPMHRIFIALASALAACMLVDASLSIARIAPTGALLAAAGRSGGEVGVADAGHHRGLDGGTAYAEARFCRSDSDCALTRVASGESYPGAHARRRAAIAR